MSNLNLFNQSWNDTVFEGRNKEYGAFQLRKENPKTTLIALGYGILLTGLLISIPYISKMFKEKPIVEDITDNPFDKVIEFEIIKPPVKQPEKAVVPFDEPEKSSKPQKKHVPPTVTDKPDTTSEVPVLDPVVPIKTGSTDNPGDGDGKIALGNSSSTGGGSGTGEGLPTGTGNEIHMNVGLQSSPEFPGGVKKFLEQVGSRFKTPDLEENGVMKIFVSFVVEKDGSLSNIKVLRDPGHGLGKEAIRVLKSINTRWKPGYQDDKPVRTAYNLPISVVIKG